MQHYFIEQCYIYFYETVINVENFYWRWGILIGANSAITLKQVGLLSHFLAYNTLSLSILENVFIEKKELLVLFYCFY